jgi:hypothetical protein
MKYDLVYVSKVPDLPVNVKEKTGGIFLYLFLRKIFRVAYSTA